MNSSPFHCMAPPRALLPWLRRVEQALRDVRGHSAQYRSSQTHDEERTCFNGQHVQFRAVIVLPTDFLDERLLPLFQVVGPRGDRWLADPSELSIDDPAVRELLSAACAGFAVARQHGMHGPVALAASLDGGEMAQAVWAMRRYQMADSLWLDMERACEPPELLQE